MRYGEYYVPGRASDAGPDEPHSTPYLDQFWPQYINNVDPGDDWADNTEEFGEEDD
jgi:hypothetical protein